VTNRLFAHNSVVRARPILYAAAMPDILECPCRPPCTGTPPPRKVCDSRRRPLNQISPHRAHYGDVERHRHSGDPWKRSRRLGVAEFDINVFSLMPMTRCVQSIMRGQGSGRIINASSVAGKLSTPIADQYDALHLQVAPVGPGLEHLGL